ncbi:hypothetical protein ACFQBQ_07095 [Granulicella cerasi]|uniref:Outer membrane protein beta-barrel domain-containing protein n=1 Tax=Granulicella cerasi TaxID=741063 RepID=A0ABW1Z6Z1_9BACT|nr:hypothetical protein [Granulicella cerasi]
MSFSGWTVKAVTLAAVLSASALAAAAQTPATTPVDGTAAATVTRPTLDLSLPKTYTAEEATFSSSSADNEIASNLHPALPGLNAFQYGSRRTGRPRYRGGNRTDDGAKKWGAYVGGGLTGPITDDSNWLTLNYSVGGGVTRNFNRKYALSLGFDWDNFGNTTNSIHAFTRSAYLDPTNSYGVGANTHIWSFTLNPQYNFYNSETFGAYAVVGGGFYHKATNFYVPATGTYCDYYGYCYQYVANQTVDNYISNSAGVNGGIGITYRLSRFASEKLYAEARIVHTFNNFRPGADGRTASDSQLAAYSGWNFFPQNSQETTYIPVKVGIRF